MVEDTLPETHTEPALSCPRIILQIFQQPQFSTVTEPGNNTEHYVRVSYIIDQQFITELPHVLVCQYSYVVSAVK